MQRVACYVAVVALVLGGGVVFGADLGDDCQNLNVTLKEESSDVDPSDPTYVALAEYFFGAGATFDVCWSQEVIGTIQGTWVLCWREGLLVPNPVFDIPGVPTDPGVEVWGNPGVIHTKKGDIYVMSYGLSVWDYAADPDAFIAWGFRRLLAHRLPVYNAMGDRWGVVVEAAEIEAVQTPQDFDALIAEAIRRRA